MSKFLRVTMPDGSRWDVPVEVIAMNRTKYYSEKDGFMEGSFAWREEYESSMADEELIDWSANNMNWEDVVSVAVKVPPKKGESVDYQEGWVNGEKEIIKSKG